MSILRKIFGDPNEKFLKSLRPIVEKINSLETEMRSLSDERMRGKTAELKKELSEGETLDDALHKAFALVREASRRVLGQRHFDVQLIGGIVLHRGRIAEMRTGEGKTLTATLTAYLNALEGKGVHIITVNDYLAKRDVIWMGQIYDFLGLTVGCITHEGGYVYDAKHQSSKSKVQISNQTQSSNDENLKPDDELDRERDIKGGFKVVEDFLKPVSKKEAYAADITYGTNHEFGFDYLRDNMAYDVAQMVQRGLNYAIIDEVDSILIDEARVPLIISGQAEDASEKYRQFSRVVSSLDFGDYEIDEKMKSTHFTESGQGKIIKNLGADPWAENDITTTHQLESALKAKTLFLKDKDYVVKNNEVVIVDEFTGRMLPGRRWAGGLHQAVEAKEGVAIQPESATLATITFQNFFRLYKKIAGMTGTALTSAEEFDKVYKLDVVSIPTNKLMVRKDFQDKIYKTEAGKFKAVAKQIKDLREKGCPVLVGTKSVEKNEYLGKLLEAEGIPCQILNAKNHEKEGEIIAQAGKKGAVTIATNMAGRGVDIILGGNPPDAEEARKIRDLGGLCVLGTERHDARRIDNQLRGRAGRQGDLGSSRFFVSLEDDLMRIFGGDRIKSLMTALNIPEDEPIQAGMISSVIESAQAKVEGFNFDARHHLLEYDDVINKHREIIYKKRRVFLEMPNSQYLPPQRDPAAAGQFSNEILSLEEIENKKKELGEENFEQAVKFVGLKVIDTLWQEHLSNMEQLRDSVRLRAYGGHDPLVEYKNEGRKLFQRMFEGIDATITENILKAHVAPVKIPNTQYLIPNEISNYEIGNWKIVPPQRDPAAAGGIGNSRPQAGRNDPCPCGAINPATGEVYKYKKCGLINAPYHKK